MIKLVENELIKIFKRKSIYLLFILSFIGIIVYNNINPEQNPTLTYNTDTKDRSVESVEEALKNIDVNSEEYIYQKISIETTKLWNEFDEGSWQRFALKEEGSTYGDGISSYMNLNKDIDIYLKNIFEYELNGNGTKDIYENSKLKYNEYVEALKSNDWKNFVNLKIKNLEEMKNNENISSEELEAINFEIECYKLRLNNNIGYQYNNLAQYIELYKENHYFSQMYKNNSYNESQSYINYEYNLYSARAELCKYALDNNLDRDISNEKNIIYDNKIDARIFFIRTFRYFDIIVVIIAIYISTTTITEETNKRTMKNLLTKPHKRSKIIISKIIACIITIIISMIFVVISQYLIGGIIFGFDSYNLDYIGYDFNNSEIVTMNLIKYICIVGILKLPIYITIILFCIFMGVINDNQAMTMILTLIIFFIGSVVLTEWSKVETLSIITRYFVTNNWDFSVYMFGQVSNISGVNLIGSIINCFIHFIIIAYLTIHKFNKKDIYNV